MDDTAHGDIASGSASASLGMCIPALSVTAIPFVHPSPEDPVVLGQLISGLSARELSLLTSSVDDEFAIKVRRRGGGDVDSEPMAARATEHMIKQNKSISDIFMSNSIDTAVAALTWEQE